VGSFVAARRSLAEEEREDFSLIVAAVLTLLGLLIGFSFSMATSRYDQPSSSRTSTARAAAWSAWRHKIS